MQNLLHLDSAWSIQRTRSTHWLNEKKKRPSDQVKKSSSRDETPKKVEGSRVRRVSMLGKNNDSENVQDQSWLNPAEIRPILGRTTLPFEKWRSERIPSNESSPVIKRRLSLMDNPPRLEVLPRNSESSKKAWTGNNVTTGPNQYSYLARMSWRWLRLEVQRSS
jgi:hypothetical protein